jgi:molecular chaperone HtpG
LERSAGGHRKENLLSPDYEDTFFGSNIKIRIRFLTALIRIADECDVTDNRTPEIVFYTLKPAGASEEEFKKHLNIHGIGQETPYKLVLGGVAKTPMGVEVFKAVQNKIQTQLDSIKTILAANGVLLDAVEAKPYIRGFINKPISFNLDRNSIVDLLIGRALYSRKDVAVRELLQNSIDSCLLRKTIENDFRPLIEVKICHDKISFSDNGLGMNFEDALNFFSNKGAVLNDLNSSSGQNA